MIHPIREVSRALALLLVCAACDRSLDRVAEEGPPAVVRATSYTLTILAPAHGAIAGATSGVYAAGSTVTLTATRPDATYGVRGWTHGGAPCGAGSSCQITMDADKTVGVEIGKAIPGSAADVTGGTGGEVVTAETRAELEAALCDSVVASHCADATPRVVQLRSIVDFTGSEGTGSAPGCVYSNNGCSQDGHTELILDIEGACSGITTSVSYDAAGRRPLLVGSNKTLVGIGHGAGLRGKGLRLVGGVSNVIVRNLSITDINEGIIWGGDAITIDGASGVWIDHDLFARIGRMMVVAGWGAADRVTISNNVFDGTTACGHYCDRRHYWNVLLAGDGQRITLAGNEFRNTSGDAPQLQKGPSAASGGAVHLVNNYWNGSARQAIVASDAVVTVVEGSWFDDASSLIPIRQTGAEPLVAPLDAAMASLNVQCQSVLGRDCAANRATNTTSSFVVNATVLPSLQSTPAWQPLFAAPVPYDAAHVPARVNASAGPKADPDG